MNSSPPIIVITRVGCKDIDDSSSAHNLGMTTLQSLAIVGESIYFEDFEEELRPHVLQSSLTFEAQFADETRF